jgi:hypothetical protein
LYILRENGCVNYEKPFLYLFFGSQKALLIDTGAGETHVASAVSGVIDEWAARNHREPPPLLVGIRIRTTIISRATRSFAPAGTRSWCPSPSKPP